MPQPTIREQLSLVGSRFSDLLERAASPSKRPSGSGWQGQPGGSGQGGDLVATSFQGTQLSYEGVAPAAMTPAIETVSQDEQALPQEAGTQPAGHNDVAEQLATMKEQYKLKQQEVTQLQAQVQRLCEFVDAAVAESAGGDGSKARDVDFSALRSQLESTSQELSQTKSQLQSALEASQQAQALLTTTAAAKAALEKRAAALKMLLAEHIRDNVSLIKGLELCQEGLEAAHIQLQEAERQRTALEGDLANKERERQSLQEALNSAQTHIAQLTEEQVYLQQMQQPLPQVALSRKTSSTCQHSTGLAAVNAELEEQNNKQQSELDKQKQELEKQRQELAAAGEQLQALSRLLAIKEDNLAYANRHSSILEQQLESLKQQLSEAHGSQQQTSVANSPCRTSSPLPTDSSIATGGGIQRDNQQQQQQLADAPVSSVTITRTSSTGFLDGIAAALSNRFGLDDRDTSSPMPGSPAGLIPAAEAGSATSSFSASPTKFGEQMTALGPLAKARNLMAQREENVIARLKEELRDKDKQVKELASSLAKAESQLHGLQTVLAAKTGACNRLESEMSKLDRQLKQVQAAAAADADGYRQQMGILTERVLLLEGQLSAAQQHEQQLQLDLLTVRTKLAEVLGALIEETELTRNHKPQQQALLKEDMAAALAEVDPTASSVAAAAHAAITGSSAAALAILGTPASAAANTGKESLGNKLLGALTGRKSSAGLGDLAVPPERVLSRIGSREASWNSRHSSEWQVGSLRPTAKSARSGSLTPPPSVGHTGGADGIQGVSRRASDSSGLPPPALLATGPSSQQQPVQTSTRGDRPVQDNPSPQGATLEGPDGAGLNLSTTAKMSSPDPVQAKLAAVRDLLHQLGSGQPS